MKKRTFTKEQKLAILKEASEQGVSATIDKSTLLQDIPADAAPPGDENGNGFRSIQTPTSGFWFFGGIWRLPTRYQGLGTTPKAASPL